MPKAGAQTNRSTAAPGGLTRAQLLAAAASLIVERGWGSVTTRAVADRAGVNQALVHYHFGTMENLLRESVIARLMPQIQGLVNELLDDRPIPDSIHVVMGLLDRFDLDTEVGVLMAEAMLRATRDQAMSAAMGGVVGSWAGLLEPRLQVAQARGVIRADVDAASMALVIVAIFDGFLIQRMADPDIDVTRTADTLIRLLSPGQEDA